MFGKLTPDAIESVLHAEIVGRIGYVDRRGVDRVVNAADWCSVVARGTFDRLEGGAAVEAVERISDRLRTVAAAISVRRAPR
jgi:hypothetical protein